MYLGMPALMWNGAISLLTLLQLWISRQCIVAVQRGTLLCRQSSNTSYRMYMIEAQLHQSQWASGCLKVSMQRCQLYPTTEVVHIQVHHQSLVLAHTNCLGGIKVRNASSARLFKSGDKEGGNKHNGLDFPTWSLQACLGGRFVARLHYIWKVECVGTLRHGHHRVVMALDTISTPLVCFLSGTIQDEGDRRGIEVRVYQWREETN